MDYYFHTNNLLLQGLYIESLIALKTVGLTLAIILDFQIKTSFFWDSVIIETRGGRITMLLVKGLETKKWKMKRVMLEERALMQSQKQKVKRKHC